MKELHARAHAGVAATQAEAVALLRDVERYPEWYPDGVKEVTVLDRAESGEVTRVRATLHVAQGPLVRDFGVTLDVTTPGPGTVKLARRARDGRDQEQFAVTWQVTDRSGVRIDVTLDANLSVPRLLPMGGVGEGIAQGFVGAAARALAAR